MSEKKQPKVETVDDVESGSGPAPVKQVTLNADDYEIDPIPSMDAAMEIPNIPLPRDSSTRAVASGAEESVSSTTVATTQQNSRLAATLELLWRQHVRSRTQNPQLQSFLERLFYIFLFLASFLEGPLNFLLGQHNNGNTQQKRSVPKPILKKGMVATRLGAICYQMAEAKQPKLTPIVCIHSSPLNSDEFMDVLPVLAATERRVVAMDLPGYGASENPPRSCRLEEIADALLQVTDQLLLDKFVVVGSWVGACVAVSLAARHPNRVLACVLANLLYYPPHSAHESEKSTDDGVAKPDSWKLKDDGSHLLELHNQRSKWLDPELNIRIVQANLTYLVNRRQRYAKGISIQDVADFDLETQARRVKCPSLCVRGDAALAQLDTRKVGGTQRFDTACRLLPHAEVQTLSGPRSTETMIPQSPEEFASICTVFLQKHSI